MQLEGPIRHHILVLATRRALNLKQFRHQAWQYLHVIRTQDTEINGQHNPKNLMERVFTLNPTINGCKICRLIQPPQKKGDAKKSLNSTIYVAWIGQNLRQHFLQQPNPEYQQI
jgi:hypothetical protein